MNDPMEAVRRLLERGYRARAEDLPAALMEVAPLLGVEKLCFYLVDYEQTALRPLRDDDSSARQALSVEGTLAGQAYTTMDAVQVDVPGGTQLWLPLLNGAERLGVMEALTPSAVGRELRRDLRAVAAVVAELVASRRHHGDTIEHTRRRLPMQLAAEIIWNQLPPLTFATDDTAATAVLEPCYDVGGDAFDYAVNGCVFHVALFDTVGHGISASALTTLAVNGYRNARRCGLTLRDTYSSVDKWVRAQYPGAFVTAILAELDTSSGTYRRICAGHPVELHLRDGRVIRQLPGPNALPLGLGHMRGQPPAITEEELQPGDSILFYTDGVTDARSADGEFFGVEGLTRSVTEALAHRAPPAEIMRRLLRAILAHQHGELRDDATAVLLQWRTKRTTRQTGWV
ncbi:MAG TPA: PP2C family protein-serine/threonine phosphatase [Micromonosporaceae bacterium]|nr:PP2C family protein-serine/threonine phosphatase [Micromonosporaceae bacterium]